MNSQIHIIYNNVLEMLKDRNYDHDFIDKYYGNKDIEEIKDMILTHNVNIHVNIKIIIKLH